MGEGRNPLCDRFHILRDTQVQSEILSSLLSEFNHFLEFPRGIDMHHGKWQGRGVKRLYCEVQQD